MSSPSLSTLYLVLTSYFRDKIWLVYRDTNSYTSRTSASSYFSLEVFRVRFGTRVMLSCHAVRHPKIVHKALDMFPLQPLLSPLHSRLKCKLSPSSLSSPLPISSRRSDISDAKSASTPSFITALVFNGAVFGIEILAFTILRPRFQAVYEPRTYVPIPS